MQQIKHQELQKQRELQITDTANWEAGIKEVVRQTQQTEQQQVKKLPDICNRMSSNYKDRSNHGHMQKKMSRNSYRSSQTDANNEAATAVHI